MHTMNLHPAPFAMIKSGEKTIELRLYDEKRQKIKAGDTIRFTSTETGETLERRVAKLHVFDSFDRLYQSLPLLQCGYTQADVHTAKPSDMEQYYSPQEQAKYGVVGIELCPPEDGRHVRLAHQSEARQVLSLYQDARKGPFCTWDDTYPTMAEIDRDLETENLYVMTEGGKLIGAISVVPENELDEFDCWSCKEGKEIARVVIDRAYQGRGLAFEMVQSIVAILRQRGEKAIHLSVVTSNIPAYRTYQKAGFVTVGRADLYGNHYYLMEKGI